MKYVKEGMSKLTITPFISKVFLMAYSNDIERLNEGIERRIHWRKEFLKRSSKAATKKLKAMWNNLSKGHLYQLNKLKSERLRLVLSLSFGFVAICGVSVAFTALMVGLVRMVLPF